MTADDITVEVEEGDGWVERLDRRCQTRNTSKRRQKDTRSARRVRIPKPFYGNPGLVEMSHPVKSSASGVLPVF